MTVKTRGFKRARNKEDNRTKYMGKQWKIQGRYRKVYT